MVCLLQPHDSGGWIGNDYNSYGAQSTSENGRSAWDALYDITGNSN
jgi:hypothetical protein